MVAAPDGVPGHSPWTSHSKDGTHEKGGRCCPPQHMTGESTPALGLQQALPTDPVSHCPQNLQGPPSGERNHPRPQRWGTAARAEGMWKAPGHTNGQRVAGLGIPLTSEPPSGTRQAHLQLCNLQRARGIIVHTWEPAQARGHSGKTL